MKRKIMSLCVAASLALAAIGGVPAHALPPETDVSGVVTNSGGPVAGATVTVKCGAQTSTDTTNASGTYLVTFTPAQCPPGSTVMVMAQKGTQSGSKTGTVIGLTTKLNVGLINVVIPEFGVIASILALGAGLGAVVYSRRRMVGQNTTL
ncbi:MAG TPA: carboxypeptidase-like regulatory domain-containing protein [Candidatus Acidoferrum sp.]|nr:carboxypeptidase-like regulatory domain-containing protein [Candidatus Acidoferrum sp.]